MLKHKFVSLALIGSTMGPNLLAMDQKQPRVEQNAEQKVNLKQEHNIQNGDQQAQSNAVPSTAVIEPPKDPMTQSVKESFANSGLIEFFTAQEDAKTEKIPLIQSIVRRTDSSWPAHIDYGYAQNQFKPADLSWVIQEYSSPTTLSRKQSETLFKSMIIDIAQKRKTQVKDLLATVAIPKKEYFSREKFNAQSHSEKYNVLGEAIENNHLQALKEIFTAFPEFIDNITISTACQRYERGEATENGWATNTYNYSLTSYSLIGWLMRKNGHYMETQKKSNYINAAKIVLERKVDGYDKLKPIKNVDNNLFNLAKTMFISKDIAGDLFDTITKKLEPEKAQ